jgi:hypothetical protein
VIDNLVMICQKVTINHVHSNDGGVQAEEGILSLPTLFQSQLYLMTLIMLVNCTATLKEP